MKLENVGAQSSQSSLLQITNLQTKKELLRVLFILLIFAQYSVYLFLLYASTVFFMSIVTVIGPTPPGTGVI